jgi:uncharacterized protein
VGSQQALVAADLRRVMVAYRDVLQAHQQVINRLNVYPVPDGDTGTNMARTLESVVGALEDLPADAPMADVCRAMAHGSLMGARGNSGVILSQLLRGLAERFGRSDAVGPTELTEGLVLASDLAREAVLKPVEGTILTVARAAGQGAVAAVGQSLSGVVAAAFAAAADALANTPKQLEVLAKAGVVDAGGSALVLLFDAFRFVLDDCPLPEAASVDSLAGPELCLSDGQLGGPRYEVMYLLSAPDDTISAFKEVWAGLGDSIVVVGGEGLWNCHIHTDDIGGALEAALDCGRPRSIRVTDLHEQVEEERWVREGAAAVGEAVAVEEPSATTGVVAVVTGDGIGRIFRSLGVHHQVLGGQSMNPSTAEILAAVEAVGSDEVVILPNNANIIPVAEQVDALTEKVVRVVATKSIVEGFTALLSYDPGAESKANAEAMAASASHVVSAEVTRAVRDAPTEAGPVRAGDWMGLSGDGVLSIGDSPGGAACDLLERLVEARHELVTLIEGDGSTPGDTRRITEWLSDNRPEAAVEVHHGGQPLYPYLFGIE